MRDKGFSLIELIMSMLVVAICMTPTALIYSNVLQKLNMSRSASTAVNLCEEKTDEITRLGFSGAANIASTPFASPFANYSYTVTVINVDLSDLNTEASPPETNTGYKNATVSVTSPAAGTVSMRALLTDF